MPGTARIAREVQCQQRQHLPLFSFLAGAVCLSYLAYIAVLGLFPDKRKLIFALMRGAKKRFQVKPS